LRSYTNGLTKRSRLVIAHLTSKQGIGHLAVQAQQAVGHLDILVNKDISYRHNRKKARNQFNRGASRRRCYLQHCYRSARGSIFFGNRRAAAGHSYLVCVPQGHVLRFPSAVRLHNVERGVIEEGIERPVCKFCNCVSGNVIITWLTQPF
jgi:hypothetical protein